MDFLPALFTSPVNRRAKEILHQGSNIMTNRNAPNPECDIVYDQAQRRHVCVDCGEIYGPTPASEGPRRPGPELDHSWMSVILSPAFSRILG